MHQKPRAKRQLLKFLLNHLCCSALCRAMPCRTSLARPDKARRINIFYLSVAAGAEWCCQVVRGGVESQVLWRFLGGLRKV